MSVILLRQSLFLPNVTVLPGAILHGLDPPHGVVYSTVLDFRDGLVEFLRQGPNVAAAHREGAAVVVQLPDR
jgi:hypothetical protein